MKKYVLNIEKLYSGQTANALVLNQVDCDLPILIPFVDDSIDDLNSWIKKWQTIYDFNPPSYNRDEMNDYIMDFNLNIQTEFKNKGHNEVYMLDDTQEIHPNYNTFSIQKKYLHSLNGKFEIKEDNNKHVLNSSQLNIIFPFKKMLNKSLYSTQLTIDTDSEIDEKLEMSRNITLQGRISYEKCVQSISNVGNNLYVMSPELELYDGNIYPNGMSIVNGGDKNFVFPNSMTLFQHQPNATHKDNLVQEFIDWYDRHDHKVIVEYDLVYGSHVSLLKYIGKSSYELKLATYSPIVVQCSDSGFTIPNKNQRIDDKAGVGLLFNLYDSFITEQEKILRLKVPIDRNFNRLKLYFDLEFVGLVNDSNANIQVYIDGEISYRDNGCYTIYDTSIDNINSDGFNGHVVDISVIINYEVDSERRNSNQEYVEELKKSGVLVKNIRVENGGIQKEHLTYGSYVNEYGISESERLSRYKKFWTVSQYRKDIAYQTILESSLRNIGSSKFEYHNNYSTGDMYGDVFVTKSILNPLYDMQIDVIENCLSMPVRDYIGLGSCSNQLSLIYNQAEMKFNSSDFGVYVKRCDEYNGMKYQMVEVVKNINRFESSIKHKSNVFSVVVENSNLAEDRSQDSDPIIEEYKEKLRNSIIQFVRNTCEGIVPVHTQLFDVQFT